MFVCHETVVHSQTVMTAMNNNLIADQMNLAGGARLMLGRVTPGLGRGMQMLDRVGFMAGARGPSVRTRLRE